MASVQIPGQTSAKKNTSGNCVENFVGMKKINLAECGKETCLQVLKVVW